MRIFQIAKECGVQSDVVIAALKEKGVTVKNRMQDIEESMADEVAAFLKAAPAAVAEKQPRKEKPKRSPKKHTAGDKPASRKPVPPTDVPPPSGEAVKPGAKKPDRRKTSRDLELEKVRPKELEEEDKLLQKIISQQRKQAEEDEVTPVIEVQDPIVVRDLARKMNVDPAQVLKKLVEWGHLCTLNQPIDFETAQTISLEFGFEARVSRLYASEETEVETENPDDLKPRPPIVTIMGHVDHGKTTLLDYIRRTDVAGQEAGGITQHIGASVARMDDGRKIVFIDTPGHEAFTAMRARGALVTDIVVLIVAADDGVMPQTEEAIRHAQAAGCPIIVAINKCDLPQANPEKVKQDLASRNLVPEDWGGDVQMVNISAKSGDGVDNLLELILFQAELMELTANPDRPAVGTVVESQMEPRIGVQTVVIVQKGTLKIGDTFVCGPICGKVRNMFDEQMNPITEAGPSYPALILGCNDVPEVGDRLTVVENEKKARSIAEKRMQMIKDDRQIIRKKMTLESLSSDSREGERVDLNIVLKADRKGSVEALTDMLLKLSTTDEVQIKLIATGVGAINDGDVLLASAGDAIVIGFQVRPVASAEEIANREGVEVKIYDIIYNLIDDVKDAITGMLKPRYVEELVAKVEVREVFKVSKVGTVAGCFVQKGTVSRGCSVKVIRDNVLVNETGIDSLKRFKDDVKEVKEGLECGLLLKNFQDVKVGDVLECYVTREEKPVTELKE